MTDKAFATVSRPLETPKQWILITELFTLFVMLPLTFRLGFVPLAPIPALWVLGLYCMAQLLPDAGFDRRKLWNPRPLGKCLPQIFLMFAAGALIVAAGIYFIAPGLLFNFIRRDPAFWALLMALYPVLSVYPQGIVYRAFFFERYRPLFPNPATLIAMSTLAFAFAHIIFRNPIAVGFTVIGGAIFAWRYYETGSLLTSSFEHALYGCWMFTIGLGDYFYKGAR